MIDIHEIWGATQTPPGGTIASAVDRIERLLTNVIRDAENWRNFADKYPELAKLTAQVCRKNEEDMSDGN